MTALSSNYCCLVSLFDILSLDILTQYEELWLIDNNYKIESELEQKFPFVFQTIPAKKQAYPENRSLMYVRLGRLKERSTLIQSWLYDVDLNVRVCSVGLILERSYKLQLTGDS